MTPWRWWAGDIGERCYDLACDCETREAAIREALRLVQPGEQFRIVEARSSDAAEYEGADFVPFLRTRNEEVITAGPRETNPARPTSDAGQGDGEGDDSLP